MSEVALFWLIHAVLAFLFPFLIYIACCKEEATTDPHWLIKR